MTDEPLRLNEDGKVEELFRVVNEHYRNDICAIWERSQYFMLSDLGLLAFFYSNSFDRTDPFSKEWISATGLALSIVWLLIILTTIRWIDVWRRAVVDVEKKLHPFGPFTRGESIGGRKFHEFARPEYYAAFLALLFALLWLTVFLGWLRLK
jgi:hypothetical protein